MVIQKSTVSYGGRNLVIEHTAAILIGSRSVGEARGYRKTIQFGVIMSGNNMINIVFFGSLLTDIPTENSGVVFEVQMIRMCGKGYRE
jgi:hypothetical protein